MTTKTKDQETKPSRIYDSLSAVLAAIKSGVSGDPYEVHEHTNGKTVFVLAKSQAMAIAEVARHRGWNCSLITRQQLIAAIAESAKPPTLPGMEAT